MQWWIRKIRKKEEIIKNQNKWPHVVFDHSIWYYESNNSWFPVKLFSYNSHVLSNLSCHLMSPRHSSKTTNKNNNKTNCLQIAFHFLQPRVLFYFWGMFTFIFLNMVPPSLNLSCHLLSPPIRPPIHPIVNSCPSLKRTSTLTFTFAIQFSTVN